MKNIYKDVLDKYVELCTRDNTCEYDDHEDFLAWLEKEAAQQPQQCAAHGKKTFTGDLGLVLCRECLLPYSPS